MNGEKRLSKQERAELKRSRRLLSQKVHEYSKQVLWASDSDEEDTPSIPRKRQAAGQLHHPRQPLLPVESSPGADNAPGRDNSNPESISGLQPLAHSRLGTASAHVTVGNEAHCSAAQESCDPVTREASPAKQSPLCSTDVVPDTPTSSCGRHPPPPAAQPSTNLVRAALQRVAAQPLAPDALQDEAMGQAHSVGTDGGVRSYAAGHDVLAQKDGQSGSLPILAQAWPARATVPAQHQCRSASLGAVGLCRVEEGDVSGMSPYDVRMLAHLKRLDQKAAAMKSHTLALAEACKVALEVSPMPVRHIAFPGAEQCTWQPTAKHAAALGDLGEPQPLHRQVEPLTADADAGVAQLSGSAESAAAGGEWLGIDAAQLQQQGGLKGWQGPEQGSVAHRLAPAGIADVSAGAELPAWRVDAVSADVGQAVTWQHLPRVEPPKSSTGLECAASVQPVSHAGGVTTHGIAHDVQHFYQDGGFVPLPEGTAKLGLADALKESSPQLEDAPLLPAQQHGGNAHACDGPALPELQEHTAMTARAVREHQVTAAQMLLLHPKEQAHHMGRQPGREGSVLGSGQETSLLEQAASANAWLDQGDLLTDRPAAASINPTLVGGPASSARPAVREEHMLPVAQQGQHVFQEVLQTAADQSNPMPREAGQVERSDAASGWEQGTTPPTSSEQAAARRSSLGRDEPMQENVGEPALGEVHASQGTEGTERDDVAMEDGDSSAADSESDEEAFPLGSGRLPLSLGGRLATTGSSQRHRLSVSTRAASVQREARQGTVPFREASQKLEDYLPAKVVQGLRDAGFTRDLYPWQAEALNQPGVLKGRSLVFSAPTSAGKSAVAEVLMLRRLCEPRTADKVALLVLPFVSLCQEKETHLERLLKPLDKEVRGMYSNKSSAAGINTEATGVVVCTIEKANILVNRLLEEEKMGILSCLIIDELHMVGDEQRGYLLELLLTKLRYSTAGIDEVAGEGLQIIGMSATMSNAAAFASWLDAELYETSFRPVPLRKFVKVGRQIRDERGDQVRELVADPHWEREDHVALLARETLDAGKSVLIFCASKKKCSDVARHIADMLGSMEERFLGGEELGDTCRSDFHAELMGLADKNAELAHTFQFGVAFHHADLSHEERAIVEKAFRSGALRVLTATSTLAAGVNLPAARVIIKEWYIGLESQWLTRSQVRQMAGRAGRAGLDDAGEAILCANPKNPRQADEIAKLIQDGHDTVDSCLIEGRKGMDRAVLEVVASKAVATKHDVKRYVQCTLLAATKDFQEVVTKAATDALRSLQQRRLITWEQKTGLWGPTLLGSAVVASGLDIQDSLDYKQDLDKAREGLCLDSDLHLCYLITPRSEDVCRNWETCCNVIRSVQGVQAKVRELVGVNMGWLTREGCHLSARAKIPDKHRHTARVCRRFFTALVLSDVVDEVEPRVIFERYGVKRFVTQQLQEQAGKHAGMMAAFCERMGWRNLEMLIAAFQSRALAGVKQEIVALTEILHVGPASARLLFNGGLRNAETIARLPNTDTLVAILSRGQSGVKADQRKLRRFKTQAAKIRRGAIELLKQQKRTLIAEAKEKANAVILGLEAAVATGTPLSLPSTVGTSSTAPGSATKTPATPQGFQGLVAVEDSETLERVHQLWRAQQRWAFSLDYRPPQPTAATLAANGLLLPPLPGALEQATPIHDTFGMDVIDDSNCTKIAGVAVAWNEHSCFYLPATAEVWEVAARMLESQAAQILTHELKPQLAALLRPTRGCGGAALRPVALSGRLVDVGIAAWLAMPDCAAVSDNPNTAGFKRGEPTGVEGLLKACMQQTPTEAINALARSSALSQRRKDACKRAAGILRLYNHLHVVMKAEGLLKPLREVEMPLVPVLAQMEAVGVAVDPTIFAKHKRPLERRVAELDLLIEAAAGGPFDVASPKEVREVLFERLRLPVPACAMKPGRKHPSTDQEVLEELAGAHPVARLLQERRTLAKVLADFVNTFAHRARRASFGSPGVNGALVRIRGSFCQTSCATGRLAMEEPNLQNMPRPRAFSVEATQRSTQPAAAHGRAAPRRDHEANIREAFVAPAGRVLLSADYAQMELRLMAHLSGDARLIATLCDPGQDPFAHWAAQWLRIHPHSVTKQQRDHAKAMAYGLLYGLGKNRLAAKMEVTPQEAAQKSDDFRASIPVLDAWLKRVVEDCRARKFVSTLMGRRRYLPDIGHSDQGRRARAERQAINSTVQGSAADLCKAAMVALHDGVPSAFPDSPKACRLILQIHDELLFEIEEERLPKAALLIRQCMENAAPLSVPLRVKLNVGPSWGSLQPYTDA